MLTGQNGILNRASEAKEKTETASKDEQRKLAQAEALMNTEKTTYKGITLPEGFAPTKIEGEDSIDDGLVITDGYGNEYVWVEVPKTDEVYPTAQNMYPYNYVTRTQAKKLAEQVESESYTSGLMFGVQWDLLLKFIEEKTVTKTNDANKKSVKEKIEKELNNDSTNRLL